MTSVNSRHLVVGIDVGGTFTDFVVIDTQSGEMTIDKVPSTPSDPGEAVLNGFEQFARRYGKDVRELLEEIELIVHGTTVATNAVLTRNGARTGVLTTSGLRDMLEIRRGMRDRRHVYDNKHLPAPPLVPRELRFGVRGRVDKSGNVLEQLDHDDVRQAASAMVAAGVEAVAVAFMHSYANEQHEREVGQLLSSEFPQLDVSLSVDVANQVRLYPRLSTTVLNGFVRPVVGGYLRLLERRLREGGFAGVLLVMQSNGGVASIGMTEKRPATTFFSGPAGGPAAAAVYARAQEQADCIVVDMGGTSFEASIVRDGIPDISAEGQVGGLDLSLPFIDIHTMGAGGGSIAWVDHGSILHVGPHSAGADPGPACYGLGGTLPTCTDANVVLGYVNPDYFLGGRMRLDTDAAHAAIREHVADPLGIDVHEAARGIFDVINFNMAAGIREITTQRGYDPREFPMVTAGGAGAIHAATIADELGIKKIVIPRQSSVLCAVGMLLVDLKHDYFGSYPAALDDHDPEQLRSIVGALVERGREELRGEGVADDAMIFEGEVEMRYAGQHHEIPVRISPHELDDPNYPALLAARLHERHDELYGFSLPHASSELLGVKVSALGARPKPELAPSANGSGATPAAKESRSIYRQAAGEFGEVPIFDADALQSGAVVPGPAVLESETTTILVPEGFLMRCDSLGSYVLTREEPT
jgi:N-methylhydantoinase A